MISQREALRLKKRVEELESVLELQRRKWCATYPGGTHLGSVTLERHWLVGRIEGARMLNHAVVVTEDSDGKLNFHALPQAAP